MKISLNSTSRITGNAMLKTTARELREVEISAYRVCVRTRARSLIINRLAAPLRVRRRLSQLWLGRDVQEDVLEARPPNLEVTKLEIASRRPLEQSVEVPLGIARRQRRDAAGELS